jgi:DNA topoisomerase-2
MPIIPTVLVNGSEGIGTGWSSYIPNYNPRDIIANVRHLLNGDTMEPMDPWYKWFKGSIEKTAKEAGNSYTVCGSIEEVNEIMPRISELPIRRWTQDYKEFLESISSSNKDCKDPIIEVNLLKSLRIMVSTTKCILGCTQFLMKNYTGCMISI